MTKEEKHLWYDFLKKLPVNVNRQKNIGSYIVDFYISACRIVIEIDGRQHGEPENRAADRARDDTLYKLGITVLRYTNKQINQNFRGVCLDILRPWVMKRVILSGRECMVRIAVCCAAIHTLTSRLSSSASFLGTFSAGEG